MKKLLAALLLGLVPVFSGVAGEYQNVVSNLSQVALGPAAVRDAQTYVTGAVYSAGAVVKSGGSFFVTPRGGTSGTTNILIGGGEFYDGGVTWRPCLSGARNGFLIWNLSGSTLYVTWTSATAATNRSAPVAVGGVVGLTDPETPQGRISLVGSAGFTNVTRVVEW